VTVLSGPVDVGTTAMRTSLQRPYKLRRISQATLLIVGVATKDVRESLDSNVQLVSISYVESTGRSKDQEAIAAIAGCLTGDDLKELKCEKKTLQQVATVTGAAERLSTLMKQSKAQQAKEFVFACPQIYQVVRKFKRKPGGAKSVIVSIRVKSRSNAETVEPCIAISRR